MTEAELVISGNLTNILDMQSTEVTKLIVSALAEDLKRTIISEIDQSVKLSSFVGQSPDQEALRTMIKNIKITPILEGNAAIEIEYKDDNSHWYGGYGLPQEAVNILQEIIQSTADKWATFDTASQAVGAAIESHK